MQLPQIKELLKNTFIGIVAYASFLTIAEYHTDKKEVKEKLEKMEYDYKASNDGVNTLIKNYATEKFCTNFYLKLGWVKIENSFGALKAVKEEKSELIKQIEELLAKNVENKYEAVIRNLNLQLKLLESKEARATIEMDKDIESGKNFKNIFLVKQMKQKS